MRKGMLRGLAVSIAVTAGMVSFGAMTAVAATAVIQDQAGLLENTAALQRTADALADESGWDLLLITTDDARGMDAREYAESAYLEYTDGDDGVSLLIDMDNREVFLATSGEAIYYLSDERIETILDDAFEEVSDGKYDRTFSVMLSDISDYYSDGIPDGAYMYDEETGEVTRYQAPRSITGFEFFLALAAAFGTAAAVVGGITASYRMKLGRYHFDWKSNSSLHLSVRNDQFVRRFVTRRHIPKNPPRSGGGGHVGGSSVHTGSGGHTFGGGGRKF